MPKIPLLFDLCFIKLFKNSCAYEINDTLSAILCDIPAVTLKIIMAKPKLPYLNEKNILQRNSEYKKCDDEKKCVIFRNRGLQGFLLNEQLAHTVADRVRVAYDSMFAIARLNGCLPFDALRFVLYVNPNSPIMLADPATKNLNVEQRFNYVRDTANIIQAEVYGPNGPVPPRTIIGTTFILFDDVFEIESTYVSATLDQMS